MIKDTEDLLPEIINIAIAAGEAIMQVYNSPFSIEYKEDNSPLTLADKLSHEIIATGLKKKSPYPIVSEEMEQADYETRKIWTTFWLVDPLDGTKEFIKRNGEFTVNIALVDENMPVLGVIYLPVQKVVYYAVKGKGAYRINNAKPVTASDVAEFAEKLPLYNSARPFTVVASRSHLSADTQAFIAEKEREHGTVTTISAGSSIKFCLVAEGKADTYPRFFPTMEWDTAAGQVIVEEAGKRLMLTDMSAPLAYNKESLVNPGFIVIS